MVTLVVLLAWRTSGIRAVRRERGVRRGACIRVGRRGAPSAPPNNSYSIFDTFVAYSSQITPTLTRSGSGDRRGLLRTHAFGCRLSRSFALVTCGCRDGTIEHANRARMMTVIVVCVHAILWALVLFIICRDISLVARASRRFAVRIALIAATVFVLIAVTPRFFAAASGNQTVTAPALPALPGTATIVWCPANARILDGVAHGIIEGYDDKCGPLILAVGATLARFLSTVLHRFANHRRERIMRRTCRALERLR